MTQIMTNFLLDKYSGQCPVKRYNEQLHLIEAGSIDPKELKSQIMKLDVAA
jgi:hypothetical protein